ncbi:MAG: alpha/beta fold hydrolase [Actinobacteria bacterium]|uniref:Alpha/beta fold hydrolase n=1 Tax=Candidatus Fonsibacter lacus TaxID=2576439 RepID=A0A965LKW4_9PROT|nr:alpha/beta fold hydrolase [Candidatus Fonsibacter lacus]
MFAAVRDTVLFFDTYGSNFHPEGRELQERPVAFVSHGGPGADHSIMRPGMDPIGEYAQIVYWDHRGQGRSARGDISKYTLDENVEDLEALRAHLGIEKIVSVGTSYGGMVAMAHAARYPQSVAKLLLIVTAAHGGFNARAQEIVAFRGTPEEKEVARQLWAGELTSDAAMREYFRTTWGLYSTTFDESKRAKNEDALARAILSPEAMNRAFAPGGFLLDYDLRPELKKITAPTLVLAGRHDWICAPEFSEEIHALIPGSQLKIFENSSHSLRGDEPEEFFATLKEFITS